VNAVQWYLQRITGGLLIVLLAAHFWVEHFLTEPLRRGELTYQALLPRIANPWWQAVDIAFLLVALYHGLNGVRNILLDYDRISRRAARAATTVLILAGFLWAWWGIEAFRNLR